jgi:pimeloyl-[acyl-carrier protein] synthase
MLPRSAHPYDLYDRWRACDPVRWDDDLRGWHLTRYSDVSACLRDTRLAVSGCPGSGTASATAANRPARPLDAGVQSWMLFRPRDDHARVRAVCEAGFSAKAIATVAAATGAVIEGCLDSWTDGDEQDVMRSLAYQVPVATVGVLFGIPSGDIERLASEWTTIVEALGAGRRTTAANSSYRVLTDYLADFARSADRTTIGPLGAVLCGAKHDGRLSDEEFSANAIFLMLAGHDTTTNLIGNGVLALVEHPDQWQRLKGDPSLATPAVEELLRYDSPIQHVSRVARERITIGGRTINEQDRLWLSIGGANRDPAQFRDPHALDIGRRDNRHLAFITGDHYCLGASLGRLEARLVLLALTRRFARLESAAPPQWKPDRALRALASLRIRAYAAA